MFMTRRERSGTKLPYTLLCFCFFFSRPGVWDQMENSLSCVVAEQQVWPRRRVTWNESHRDHRWQCEPPICWHTWGAVQEIRKSGALAAWATATFLFQSGCDSDAWHLINFTVNSFHCSFFDGVTLWSLSWLGKVCISHYPCWSPDRVIWPQREASRSNSRCAAETRFQHEDGSWKKLGPEAPPPCPMSTLQSFPFPGLDLQELWKKMLAFLRFFSVVSKSHTHTHTHTATNK